jgi:hypothetical protein
MTGGQAERVQGESSQRAATRSRAGATGYTVGNDDDDLDQSVGRTDLYAPAEGHQLDLPAILEADCDSDGLGDEKAAPPAQGRLAARRLAKCAS